MNIDSKLAEAIENLYRVAEKIPFKPDFAERCSPMGERQTLARMLCGDRLRELKADALNDYCAKAVTTMGDESDLKHFLPRIFELMATDVDMLSCGSMLFQKLQYCQWREWPEVEQVAIEHFLLAIWRRIIQASPQDVIAGEWLDELALAVDDLTPFLTAWEEAGSQAALLQLAYAVVYSTDLPPAMSDWLNSKANQTRLEQAFFACEQNNEQAELFSLAVDTLTLCLEQR